MKVGTVPENLIEGLGLLAGVAPTPILDTFVATFRARTIVAANAVGIFDALEHGSRSCGQIAEHCSTQLGPTERMMIALCACGYAEYHQGLYRLPMKMRKWLVASSPTSLRGALTHQDLDLRFMEFEAYVRNGTVQGFHQNLSPEDWAVYRGGQESVASLISADLVRQAPLSADPLDLIDLGGSHGLLSAAFCERYPRLRARVLDLDIACPNKLSRGRFAAASKRVRFEMQDIRYAELGDASADVVLFSNVAHHFDEVTNRGIIQRAARALRLDGVMVCVDATRPIHEERSAQVEALLNLYFGAASGVGLWSAEDLKGWIRDAGLKALPPSSMRLLPNCTMVCGRRK